MKRVITLGKKRVYRFSLRSFAIVLVSGLCSCEAEQYTQQVTITNPTAFERKQETVSIKAEELNFLNDELNPENVVVRQSGQEEYLVTQWLDWEDDSSVDELLFQVSLAAGEEKTYEILWKEGGNQLQPEPEVTTYSRFVPERTDDYTWENDRVAFRTFGPEAQRLVEEGEPGGTLSSGIDLWLKKVNYSIIDSWYEKNDKDPGYYHEEHGEGHDPYHVGKSRGTGGSGIWLGDTLIASRNFISHRTIATGPIRTVFELQYAPWSQFELTETKRISLDLGSNFSKIEVDLQSQQSYPNYTIGITLHEGAGDVSYDKEQGWARHWESMPSGDLGEGVIVDPEIISDIIVHQTDVPDQSQILVITNPDQKITYYAGFGWTESGQIQSKQDWDEMLVRQTEKIRQPLKVSIEK